MNTNLRRSLVRLSALCALAAFSHARAAVDSTAGNAGFQYIDVPPSPRQIAMGWAGAALGENGFAYYNPAAPAIDKTSFLSIGYASLPFDYSVVHAQGSCMISNFFIGANITNHVVSGIFPSNDTGVNYNTPFSYDGTLIALNAGFINDRLGIGLTVNGLQEQIGTSAAYGISASLGLVYTLTRNITLGAAGLHLGTSTGFTDDTRKLGKGYPLPRSARAGAAFTDTIYRVPFTVTGDIVYRDVGLKVVHLSQLEPRVTVPLGIEVWPTSYVAIRAGKRLNDDSQLFTFGAGLHWSMLSFDLAITLASIVSDVQVEPFFSLTYALGKAVKAPSKAPVIMEKPVEIKSVLAPEPKAPATANSTSRPDTAAATPIAPPVKAPAADTVPQDSTGSVAKGKEGQTVEPKPVEPQLKSPQADSVQTKQPDAPDGAPAR